MADWWLMGVALALVLAPFYVFVIGKAAGAGWVSGVQSYIRQRFERKG